MLLLFLSIGVIVWIVAASSRGRAKTHTAARDSVRAMTHFRAEMREQLIAAYKAGLNDASSISDRSGPVELAGSSFCDFHIAGERYHQDALEAITGRKRGEAVSHHCAATLKEDPANIHDPNAVAVTIENRLVGYLRREHALGFVAALRAGGFAGRACTCSAWIHGTPGDDHSIWVKLGMVWPPEFEGS